jgi:hypothetical protein
MSNFVFTYGRLLAFSKFGPDQSLEFVQPRAKLSDSECPKRASRIVDALIIEEFVCS